MDTNTSKEKKNNSSKKKIAVSVIAIILLIILLLALLAECGNGNVNEDPSAENSVDALSDDESEVSEPDVSVPDVSVPDASEPDVSVPGENSEPEVSGSDVSKPDESGSDVSDTSDADENSNPEVSGSDVSDTSDADENSEPEVSGSDVSDSDVSKPDVSEPDESDEPVVHACKLEKGKKTEPTCTAQGYTVYKCECGKSEKKDYVSALGHSEGDWVTVTAATTTSTGLKRKSCTRCGTTISEETIAQLSPESIYDAVATNENSYLLEERILYYINQYRVAEGSGEMTMLEGKSRAFARGRSEQLITNFAHDVEDRRALATELEYGDYIAEHPETIYDWETDTIIYTGNTIPAYYEPYGGEAITKGSSTGYSIDNLAKAFAKTCFDSKSHWSYIGSANNSHIAVGATNTYGYGAYVCLLTSSLQYD